MLKNKEAIKSIAKGCRELQEAVKGTFGPYGHHVLLDQGYGLPLITNDGVSIAKIVQKSEDKDAMGAKILYQCASKTNQEAGDGTTTSILFACEMLQQGLKLQKYNPFQLVEGMEKAGKMVIEELEQMKQSVFSFASIQQIATMVTKCEEMGEWIARAFVESEYSGYLHIEESQSGNYHIHTQKGMQLDGQLLSPYYYHVKKELSLYQPQICLSDCKVERIEEMEPLLQYAKATRRTVLFICEDMEQEVLATIVMLHLKKQISFYVMKLQGFGTMKQDILNDLALLTKAKVYTEHLEMRLKQIEIQDLGSVDKVMINPSQIFFQHKKNDEMEQMIKELKQQLTQTTVSYERHHLLKRLERLNGTMVTLYVKAHTKSEMEEKKLRVEDAIHACQAALEEGVVAGGGLAYIEAYRSLYGKEEGEKEAIQKGMLLVFHALTKPFEQLVENAGYDASAMVKEQLAKEKGIGFDLKTNTWQNMMEQGIIDALKVNRQALENAISAASLLIRCDTCITIPKINDI